MIIFLSSDIFSEQLSFFLEAPIVPKLTFVGILLSLIIAVCGIVSGLYLANNKYDLFYLGFVVGLGFLIITSINIFLFNRKRQNIKLRIFNECREAQGIMKNLCYEYTQYMRDYDTNDAISDDIIRALEAL